jgi:hypothetical protein
MSATRSRYRQRAHQHRQTSGEIRGAHPSAAGGVATRSRRGGRGRARDGRFVASSPPPPVASGRVVAGRKRRAIPRGLGLLISASSIVWGRLLGCWSRFGVSTARSVGLSLTLALRRFSPVRSWSEKVRFRGSML